jgi:short-subunit dehydrogenase
VIVKDLSEQSTSNAIFDDLQAKKIKIDYLKNNAGFGYKSTKINKTVVVQWFVNSIMAQSVRFAPLK